MLNYLQLKLPKKETHRPGYRFQVWNCYSFTNILSFFREKPGWNSKCSLTSATNLLLVRHHAFHRPLEPAGEPLVAPNRRSCLFQTCGRRRLANGTLCSIFQRPGTRIDGVDLERCQLQCCAQGVFHPYCFGSRFLRSATRSWQPFHASISKIPKHHFIPPSHVRASCSASERCGGNEWLLAISAKSTSKILTAQKVHSGFQST